MTKQERDFEERRALAVTLAGKLIDEHGTVTALEIAEAIPYVVAVIRAENDLRFVMAEAGLQFKRPEVPVT